MFHSNSSTTFIHFSPLFNNQISVPHLNKNWFNLGRGEVIIIGFEDDFVKYEGKWSDLKMHIKLRRRFCA